jgi:hypothetical protein
MAVEDGGPMTREPWPPFVIAVVVFVAWLALVVVGIAALAAAGR